MDALVICRFAHFMAAAQVFGASAYLWLYAPQDLRGALSPSIWRIGVVSSLVALVSAVLLLVLEAATMADDWRAAIDPGVITAVLADTDFGRVWLLPAVSRGSADRCRLLAAPKLGDDHGHRGAAPCQPRTRRTCRHADRFSGESFNAVTAPCISWPRALGLAASPPS